LRLARKALAVASASCLCLLAGCSHPKPAKPNGAEFRDIARSSGLIFQHFTGATGQFYLPEIMGAGVALLDYDNDGDLDVFLVQGTILEPGKSSKDARFPPSAGWKPGNRLFRNLLKETGKLQFEDVSEKAGLAHVAYGMGVAVGDFNNDGYADLYVTNFGANILYRNNGDGTFKDVTRDAGVEAGGWSASASFFDYDRDGYLDLYVARYLDFTVQGNRECFSPAGERDYCAPSAYKAVLPRLYRNLGNGKFQDVTQSAGIAAAAGPALGVACADFDGDGWPDLYVANDGAANLLWLNNRNGTFHEAALLSGAAYSADGVARAGMGVAAGDFDGSGRESIFVTNLMREGAGLFRNQGAAQFADATMQFGIYRPTYRYTGFGVSWFDYDNDGAPDLFIANGAVTRVETQRGMPYPFNQPNLLLHNETTTFRDVSAESGPPFQLAEVGRGAAFGDLDNDGRVDIVISNNNGEPRLLLNRTPAGNHWLTVRLQGAKLNLDAIGARVAAISNGEKPVWRRVHTDGSYLSASDIRVHFGIGSRTEVQVLVNWPDGSRELWPSVQADAIVTLRQGAGVAR
jgi:hypothetical protein